MKQYAFILVFILMTVQSFAQIRPQQITRTAVYMHNGRYRTQNDKSCIKGHVKHHIPAGKWKYSHRIIEANGKEHWQTYMIIHFAEGQRNGLYLEFDDHGDTTVIGHYSHDKMVGDWTYWFNDPSRTEPIKIWKKYAYDSGGRPTGTWYEFNADGSLFTKRVYYDSAHFYVWRYQADGRLAERGAEGNDRRNGTWYTYVETNNVTSPTDTLPFDICEWTDGAKDGVEKIYDHGVLREETHYRNGVYDGAFRHYQGGVLIYEYNYTNGHFDGLQQTFTPSGTPLTRTVYDDNVLTEKHQCDSATGKIIQSYWYTKGNIDSVKEWSVSGQLLFEKLKLTDSAESYVARSFYIGGVMCDSTRFPNSMSDVEHFHWYENGQLQVHDHRTQNGYNATLDVWNEKGVHVIHALPSRSRDTIPEIVYSDAGKRLAYGTVAFNAQIAKYFPSDCAPYDERTFYLHTIVVMSRESRQYGNSRAVSMEVSDSVSTNKRKAPQFPGGQQMMYRYFSNNIHYPEIEKDAGISGNTWISFHVMSDGSIDSCIVVHACSPGCDKEALRVVRSMPAWEPAMKKGKPIESECVLEVKWVLKYQ